MARKVNDATPPKTGDHSPIDRAYEDVPDIGVARKRWYDIPYHVLWWMITGSRRKLSPRAFRSLALRGVNELLQYNVLERYRVWDKTDRNHNPYVPEGEHVTMPSITVIELFTPNEIMALDRSIKKNGWNKGRFTGSETNSERLSQARLKHSSSWWRLADIAKEETSVALRGNLPDGVRRVQLSATQIGSGLTAVIASFSFDDSYAMKLDVAWHGNYEPAMSRVLGRLRPMDRKQVAIRKTLATRDALHKSVRQWMNEYCPGYFASHDEAQVSLDIIITEKYNPVSRSEKRPDPDFQDAFRALGINVADFERITSSKLPALLLAQADRYSESPLNSARTWGIITKRKKIQDATENFKFYGGDANSGIAHIVDEDLRYTLILLAVSQLLLILEAQYAKLRDGIGLRYQKFSTKNLKDFSATILDTSLTLASIKQDIADLQKSKWWFESVKFTAKRSPYFVDKTKRQAIDLHESILNRQEEVFKRLTKKDADYRNILTSLTSLGASEASVKLGHKALWVSISSVLVAIAALWVAYATYIAEDSSSVESNSSPSSMSR